MIRISRRLRTTRHGQVATYLVVWTMVICLLAAVLMNIGQVASVRTATANAADSSALLLASRLGAIAWRDCKGMNTLPDCHSECGSTEEAIWDMFFHFLMGSYSIIGAIIWVAKDLLDATANQDRDNASLNARIGEADIPLHDQLREEAILNAMSQMVDDPRVVPDDYDIDDDGNNTELISSFAHWFDDRLRKLDHPNSFPKKEVRKIYPLLLDFRDKVRDFVDFLNNRLDPLLETLCPAGGCYSFPWQPGDVLPADPPGGTGILPDCDPNISTCSSTEKPNVADEVEWMVSDWPGTPRDFIAFVKHLEDLKQAGKLVKRSKGWSKLLKGYWNDQLSVWWTIIDGWKADLSTRSGVPQNVTDTLIAFQQEITDISVEITNFFARGGPPGPRPVYRWWDNRGWHQVKVWVHKFNVPELTFWRRGIVRCRGIEDRACNNTLEHPCPRVTVWRFDEDKTINRGWTFKVRRNPAEENFACEPDDDPDECPPPYEEQAVTNFGIRSYSAAHYSWQPEDIRLVGVR